MHLTNTRSRSAPPSRTGARRIEAAGAIATVFDEERGPGNLAAAIRFSKAFAGQAEDLVRTMRAPDRLGTCTP